MEREKFHHKILSSRETAVYDVVLPPHAKMRYHAHPTNHLAIVIDAGPLRNEVIGRQAVDRPTGPSRTVVYVAAGPAHRQTNTGAPPIRFIAVETAGGSITPPVGTVPEEAVLEPPELGCHVILEKPDAKVTRCLLMPGDAVTPGHKGPFLRIPIGNVGRLAWLAGASPVANRSTTPSLFIDLDL